jgi:hypothetical protein
VHGWAIAIDNNSLLPQDAPMVSNRTIGEGLELLGERNFLRLFCARLVSMFGSSMTPLALAFGVLELTGSPVEVGLVVASGTAAQVAIWTTTAAPARSERGC